MPKTNLPPGFTQGREGDLLFADKNVSAGLLAAWNGPIVFETGSTGIELSELPLGAQPAVWTAGIGSFIRTITVLAGREVRREHCLEGVDSVLSLVDSDAELRPLFSCPETLRRGYAARLLSKACPNVWRSGFAHATEVAYCRWLQGRWAGVSSNILTLLGVHGGKEASLRASPGVGCGVVVTAHEAGLMALWQVAGRWRSIVVEIESYDLRRAAGVELRFECIDVPLGGDGDVSRRLPSCLIRVGPEGIDLQVEGAERAHIGSSPRLRRNTLAAGDTVRGGLVYGLWALLHESDPAQRPADIAHVLLASCLLASAKSYTGSFVDFLRAATTLRETPAWRRLWGFSAPLASRQP